jgi:hypothetical protein
MILFILVTIPFAMVTMLYISATFPDALMRLPKEMSAILGVRMALPQICGNVAGPAGVMKVRFRATAGRAQAGNCLSFAPAPVILPSHFVQIREIRVKVA